MKKIVWLLAVPVVVALHLAGAVAEENRTRVGEFVWDSGGQGTLEAVFTATGEGRWDVVFRFKFRGERHVYTGTAEGSLTDGTLSGTVLNENQRRTFTFSGDVQEGRFSGRHSEVQNGREKSTGTLTLGG